jgi:predicted phage-related endonuclease
MTSVLDLATPSLGGRARVIAYESYEEWKADRTKFVGGSEIGAVVHQQDPEWPATGVKAGSFDSPLDVYLRKVQPDSQAEESVEAEARMWLGRELESTVIELANKRWGMDFQNTQLTTCFDPDNEAFGCTLDGWSERMDANVEVKTTGNKWKYPRPVDDSEEIILVTGDDVADGRFPRNTYWQVQWGMSITGRKKCYVVVLGGGSGGLELNMYLVRRDDADIAHARKVVGNFWSNYVAKRMPPAPQLPQDCRTAQEQWPNDGGEVHCPPQVVPTMLKALRFYDYWSKLADGYKAQRELTKASVRFYGRGKALRLVDPDTGSTWVATFQKNNALKVREIKA